MLRERIILSVLMIGFGLMTSCNQDKIVETTVKAEEKASTEKKERHPYGGWFCPDNFGGFPPVDIKNLLEVPVVNDRLPTKEETRDGRSLIFVEKSEYPNAEPLDMTMPRVARHYSSRSGINELIIVIQAVVVGSDTIVGFRYPSGGNGSARYGEVTFLSDEEVDQVGSTPFVYLNTEINASMEKIWQAITQTAYAKKMGVRFDKKEFFESEWTSESRAHLDYKSDGVRATGIVTNMFGNLYMHVDYDKNDFHFAEKVLVSGKSEEKNGELHIVSGPYPEDVEVQKAIWQKWIDEVKELSEKD